MSLLQILADAPTTAPGSESLPFWADPQKMMLLLLGAVVVIMLFGSSRTKRKEQQQRDDMLKNMKRGDRVMTIGGILGTLVDVRDSEVVLKVDESSNTKIKFTREAIKRVVVEEASTPSK